MAGRSTAEWPSEVFGVDPGDPCAVRAGGPGVRDGRRPAPRLLLWALLLLIGRGVGGFVCARGECDACAQREHDAFALRRDARVSGGQWGDGGRGVPTGVPPADDHAVRSGLRDVCRGEGEGEGGCHAAPHTAPAVPGARRPLCTGGTLVAGRHRRSLPGPLAVMVASWRTGRHRRGGGPHPEPEGSPPPPRVCPSPHRCRGPPRVCVWGGGGRYRKNNTNNGPPDASAMTHLF